MDKVVNGRRYNTDTATRLSGHAGGDGDPAGPDHWEEALYRKRTGEYFLHGLGGARTRYAERSGSNWGAGEAVIHLTYDAAMEWAERHMDGEGFAAEFGEPEGEGTAQLRVTVPSGLAAAVRREAAVRGVAVSELVSGALAAALGTGA